MSAELKKLERKPVGSVVDALETALENAKSGDTVGLVLMEMKVGGSSAIANAGIDDRFKTIGYLQRMIYEMLVD